ncbi:MAG: VCBS repeat-containing protein [Candidatus Marinimicrobia bacterium]|nr:VCBS repeat-containing protein [Candidatus Neomarinimicrobiota bacterium]
MLKARILLGLLFGLLICAAISRAVNPWSPRPNWVSTDNEFTMSVAFADIDNEDSYLELLAGNYNYPYSSFGSNPEELGLDEIGAQLVVYYDWDQENQCYNSSTDLTETPRCIDCIAVADYNNDSHMDIAMGLVVGKGKDGGVIVLENQADTSPASMEDYFRDDVSGCYWKSDESYDCHVVRWVDFDCDGDLDLAALVVPSILHIYVNVEPISGVNMISNDCAWVYYLGTDDSGTDDLEHSTTSPIEGTTMEFGDIDNDGDLDVFINAANQARVFENIDGDYPGDYYSLNPAVQNYREDAFCGSFAPDGDQLVLAVGSFQFVDNPNDPMEEQRWGNDIYSFEDPYLVHQGRSTVSGSFPAQSVTDIQWAYLDEYDDRDLVAVSYPIYKENGPDDYIWDRGYEQIHLDPLTYTGDEFLTDIWTSSSGYSDLSTSLALGDIDGESAYIEEVIIDEATVSGNFPYLFHLDKFPFISLEEVIVIDENQNWLCWGNDDFDVAYDPLNGWISIDNRFIPPINWCG